MIVCPPLRRPSSRPVALLIVAALLGACEAGERDANAQVPANVVEPVAEKPSVLPLPDPVLDRAALLGAVAQAASAYAAGSDDRATQARLDGRRFVMKLRFGCGGPAAADSAKPLVWRVKSDTSLEIRATPDLSLADPAVAGPVDETVEAVEGFWIARPWLLSDACPAPRPQPGALGTLPDRSVGIAQYYTSEGSRVERRGGRAYVSTVALADDEAGGNETGAANTALPSAGLFLSLEGRLRPWPNGKVIRCTAAAAGARPACIISMQLNRAVFIDPRDNSEIDEWTQ